MKLVYRSWLFELGSSGGTDGKESTYRAGGLGHEDPLDKQMATPLVSPSLLA